MTDPYDRLQELGLELPTVSAPKGSYIPAKRVGNLVFIAGQIPLRNGRLLASGRVGGEVEPSQARNLSVQCLLAALAAVHSIASLSDVSEIARLVGYVASVPGFHAQPSVIDGASDLLVAVFGERGRHARTTVGVPELPLNAPVEIELTVQLVDLCAPGSLVDWGLDRASSSGHSDAAGGVCWNVDNDPAGSTHVLALKDLDPRRCGDQIKFSEVSAERGRSSARRRILVDSSRRERIASEEDLRSGSPDHVDCRPIVCCHERCQGVHVVVERS